MSNSQKYYIGLMSGTSLDGIDAVMAEFQHHQIDIIRHASIAYPPRLQKDIFALLTPADNELERVQLALHQRTELASKLVDKICNAIDRSNIASIADHGQTIRHFPNDHPPYTLQIHQGASLAAKTDITTVVDFRSKDIADGGQGAPLVPAFHQAFFAHKTQYRLIVNIGGIANISLLPPSNGGTSIGFDTGPGNTLLDGWCQQHTGKDFDDKGRWAASGTVDQTLLTQLLDEAYFHLSPPKSTGRETFNLQWIEQKLNQQSNNIYAANDIQASLTLLTAQTISLGIQQACKQADIDPDEKLEGVYVCGGGAYNTFLLESLQQQISVPVQTTEALGTPPKLVEAAAFAWFGKMAMERRAIDLRQTTGAVHSNILGAIYPA